MKYCRYCGRELVNDQCACNEFQISIGNVPTQKVRTGKKSPFLISFRKPSFESFSSFTSSIKDMYGVNEPNTSLSDPYERDVPIVPNCIAPEENEIVVRQYNIAKMRTRWKHMKAEGRLMVTNKRVLFRAAGTSLTGNTLQEHQFNLDEIGGIEIHKDLKFSITNLFNAFFLSVFAFGLSMAIFSGMKSETVIVFGIIAGLLGMIPTFRVYRRFWLKLFCANISMATLSLALRASDGGVFLSLLLHISCVIAIINFFIVCFIPNLVLKIKTKGGTDGAVSIGSTKPLLLRVMSSDYSGFSEVMPWEDTVQAINELGTLIDDLQKQGDYAIEKWTL